jgi:UDP:flavonoid glycosyltransferase YjiC (YdhE family)
LRFLLATYGTRGDVHPMLALGLALVRKGHTVALAGPPEFAGDAHRLNLEYHPMGGNITAFLARHSSSIGGNLLRMARVVKREIGTELAAQFKILSSLAKASDHVVGASLAFAARSCAEYAGRPYHFIAFAPETFPSRYHPALGVRHQHLPRWANRLTWWAARKLDNWLLREALDRGRADLGLPAITDALDHFLVSGHSLLATDAELAPAPLDVQLPEGPTGAMLLDEPGQLPDAVEAFLAVGPPPIYIGFGSMPDARPERTRAQLVDVVRRVGCRAIVYASNSTSEDPKAKMEKADILTVGSLPHALLFPRVALAVHHGGAGTSARAARAGIPQVILPHVLDQFPWSARIFEKGLGPRPLLHPRPTTGRVVARIREALDNTTMRERTARLGRDLAGRDGADRIAAILSGDVQRRR